LNTPKLLTNTFNLASLALSATLLAALSACGGSDDSTSTKPTVSEVSVDKLVYRQTSTFTIKGTDLTGTTFLHQACLNLTELGTGTATERTYTCKIIRPGLVPLVVRDKSSNTVYSANQTIPLALQPRVKISTSMGDIEVELNPAKAPISVDNFLNYTEANFYTNKIFHRVIKDFMIQGGGFTADLVEAPVQAPILLEAGNGLSNVRGTIAMARTSVLNSATAQFFINAADNQLQLDASSGGYAVFGKVITGLDIVDLIQVVPTGVRGSYSDVPTTTVLINSVTRTQ
jgi:peptidyl-prolyl cis-trans isomerase A (cyclophilin A)